MEPTNIVRTMTARLEVVGDFPNYLAIARVPYGTWPQSGTEKPGVVAIAVVDILGVYDDGTLCFEKAGSAGGEPVDSLWEAEQLVEGRVKWDGCVDWDGGSSVSGVMLHHCGADDLADFLAAVQRAYDMALEMVGGGLDA